MERDRRKSLIALTVFTFLLFSSAASVDAREKKILLLLPASPVSIPVFLAAQKLPEIQIEVFHNHERAHALFYKGEALMIVTGFSVGIRMYRQGVPIRIVNSHVDRLNYLVGNAPVESFSHLKGEKIYLPFPGSPIEVLTMYFTKSEGLTWRKDITPGYSMFHVSVDLLKSGKIKYAVLPEPFATMAEMDRDLKISLDYSLLWKKYVNNDSPCIQVGTFVNRKKVPESLVEKFNNALMEASNTEFSDDLIREVSEKTGFSENILKRSLERTTFFFLQGNELRKSVYQYCQITGYPLDERYNDFF